jgi:hypothetical protein
MLSVCQPEIVGLAFYFSGGMMDWVVILSMGLVGGTLLTLFFISRRPINVNLKVDARAEAHGGSASASAPSSSSPASSGGASVGGFVGGIFNIFIFLVIAAIAILVLLALIQKNELAKVTVNIPEQKPPVINIPAQQPPSVSVQVPQQQAPIVNAAVDSGLGYVNTIVSLVSVIIGGSMLLLVIKSKSRKSSGQTDPDYSNVKYTKTEHGWTVTEPPRQQSHPTTAQYPDLFTRDKVRK